MGKEPKKNPEKEDAEILKVPRLTLLLGLLVVIALVVYVFYHVGDAQRFLNLLRKAKLNWLILVIGLQICTYLCVGIIWYQMTHVEKYKVKLTSLARLSIEKLSVDQLIPALGISGNLIVYRAMKRLNLPQSLAMEAILINILAHYIAYGLVTLIAFLSLWYYHHVTPVILTLVGLFTIILIAVPGILILLVAKKDKKLPPWLLRLKPLQNMKKAVQSVSSKEIYSPKLLLFASVFNLIIFLLDSGSLWAVLRSLGVETNYITAFVALVLASIAATLSALPGGIGGFEAGSVAVLTLLGIPVEAALTGTIIFRGFSLWLPLLPGLYFARKEVTIKF